MTTRRRSARAISGSLLAHVRAGKKITWRRWVSAVAELSGGDRSQVEITLRAAAELLGPEYDMECELVNEGGIHNLEPNWEKWEAKNG